MSQILFLTGPAGAGKSTSAEAFAKSAPGIWGLVGQDDIRSLIKAGYVSASVKPWTKETNRQWDVSVLICCDIIKRYYATDINCVVEMFGPPSSYKEKWKPQLENIPHKIVVLLPKIEVVLARNAQRKGHAFVSEEDVKEHHEWFSQWTSKEATIIDTSEKSVDEVAELLIKLSVK